MMMQRLSVALHLRDCLQKNERTVFYLLMEHEFMRYISSVPTFFIGDQADFARNSQWNFRWVV